MPKMKLTESEKKLFVENLAKKSVAEIKATKEDILFIASAGALSMRTLEDLRWQLDAIKTELGKRKNG